MSYQDCLTESSHNLASRGNKSVLSGLPTESSHNFRITVLDLQPHFGVWVDSVRLNIERSASEVNCYP